MSVCPQKTLQTFDLPSAQAWLQPPYFCVFLVIYISYRGCSAENKSILSHSWEATVAVRESASKSGLIGAQSTTEN